MIEDILARIGMIAIVIGFGIAVVGLLLIVIGFLMATMR